MIRPLEASARTKGVRFLLNYKMTEILREPSADGKVGRVLGITVRYTPRIMNKRLPSVVSTASAMYRLAFASSIIRVVISEPETR